MTTESFFNPEVKATFADNGELLSITIDWMDSYDITIDQYGSEQPQEVGQAHSAALDSLLDAGLLPRSFDIEKMRQA